MNFWYDTAKNWHLVKYLSRLDTGQIFPIFSLYESGCQDQGQDARQVLCSEVGPFLGPEKFVDSAVAA